MQELEVGPITFSDTPPSWWYIESYCYCITLETYNGETKNGSD